MNRTTRILAGATAALALTASLAFAAGTTGSTADPTAAAPAAWNCPGAQNGQMGPRMMNSQMMGRMMNGQMPVSFEQMRAWMQSFGRAGTDAPAAERTSL